MYSSMELESMRPELASTQRFWSARNGCWSRYGTLSQGVRPSPRYWPSSRSRGDRARRTPAPSSGVHLVGGHVAEATRAPGRAAGRPRRALRSRGRCSRLRSRRRRASLAAQIGLDAVRGSCRRRRRGRRCRRRRRSRAGSTVSRRSAAMSASSVVAGDRSRTGRS